MIGATAKIVGKRQRTCMIRRVARVCIDFFLRAGESCDFVLTADSRRQPLVEALGEGKAWP